MGTPRLTVLGVYSQDRADMLVAISLCVLAHLTTGAPGYGHGFGLGHAFHGHGHGYLVSPCKHTVEEVEKEICRYEPEKKCETKTQTYKVITGYEKGECKEIDVCKHPLHHKREASAHGYGYVACVKEKKEICKASPPLKRSLRILNCVNWSLRRFARWSQSRFLNWIVRKKRRWKRKQISCLC